MAILLSPLQQQSTSKHLEKCQLQIKFLPDMVQLAEW